MPSIASTDNAAPILDGPRRQDTRLGQPNDEVPAEVQEVIINQSGDKHPRLQRLFKKTGEKNQRYSLEQKVEFLIPESYNSTVHGAKRGTF